ncbi:ketoreductase Ecym_2565 [Eremothecium cymbalariae DBVPG|uniref:Very-long-chain 3-oxoacyl-CoA reductase n=1 Tax=Eremothecium cymbalariae (strain CBS 270.75 / DBVPG 7215 / KCTC 17166 / NRRL Y-17582) TaxID=931890 RepID=G8JQC5_ERECY|nr:Hypothetical protein Ecym_2565 [Eremothecium cymbalariae DBVPG\
MHFLEQLTAVSSDSKALNALLWALLATGVVKATTLFLTVTSLLFDLLVFPSVSYKKYGPEKGSYALITGASDGIGKEFAVQLAERGFNLLLVSRTHSKLKALQEMIIEKHKVDVEILALNISEDSSANYAAIKSLCDNVPVTVLVNNVGVSHSIPVPFLETEEQELRNIIAVNNTATLMITQTVAPLIISNTKKLQCRGLILTMGSFGGLAPSPLLATYSGSKAFLQQWSSALAGELSKDNIDVQFIISYLVTSAMSKIRKTSLLIPNPQQFVRATLQNVGRRVGSQDRYATTTPYWSHALYHMFIENTVGVYSRLVNAINYRIHTDIRRRALRKAAKLAATKQE